MEQKKRETLKTIGVIGLSYIAIRLVIAFWPVDLELKPLGHPVGFRIFVAGETTIAAIDPFIGLQDSGNLTEQATENRADAHVQKDLCGTLYPNLNLAKGPVPIASFSDYYCPLCRVQTTTLSEFAKSNGDAVALAWHELPIFGEQSILAAKAALAAKRQGAYEAFHARLMKTPFVASGQFLSALSSDLNLNEAQLISDMNSASVATELENTAALARVFNLYGTPAMIIGKTVILGQVSPKAMQQIIDLEKREGWAEVCD